jgi:TonB family protein
MPRDASFWRHAATIGAAHVIILAALVRWSGDARKMEHHDILWMNNASAAEAAAVPAQSPPAELVAATETETETDAPSLEADADATPLAAKSAIELPTPTPRPSPSATPTSAPKHTPAPIVTPKPVSKTAPKPTPKKPMITKASPSPTPKPSAVVAEKKPLQTESTPKESSVASDKNEAAVATGTQKSEGSGSAPGVSPHAWYGDMLHDRFFSEWVQPKSVVASGAKMSALVKVRIERDGRVSDFAIVRSSGNVLVDDSVAAVAQRVTRVDPPPRGLGDGPYEVKINFELNLE